MTKYTDVSQVPLVLSVPDMAGVLGISRNTAYDLARSGRIRTVRIGRQIRIPKAALQEFLQVS